jgi:hypothetical protein
MIVDGANALDLGRERGIGRRIAFASACREQQCSRQEESARFHLRRIYSA